MRRTSNAHTLKKRLHLADEHYMQTATEATKHHVNRKVPVEQWPESIQILRHLALQSKPRSIKEVASEVNAPEISTRGRLSRLEVLGAVQASRVIAVLGPGKQVLCTHYEITQHGRDIAVSRGRRATDTVSHGVINSIFSLGWATKSQS